MRQNNFYDTCGGIVDVFGGNMPGSVNRRPCREGYGCGCNGVLGDSIQNTPVLPPFSPIQSQCPTCPAGTHACRPCNMNCQCGCNSNINPRNVAFYNTTAQTIAPGNIVPFSYVTGTNTNCGAVPTPTNGSIVLDCGLYLVSYSVNGVSPAAGQTITALPEYQGASHPEYARTQIVETEGGYFNLTNTFIASITTPTTLDVRLDITAADATATPEAATDVSASLTLVKLSNPYNNSYNNNCGCR